MKNNTPEYNEKLYLIQNGSRFHICIYACGIYVSYAKSTSKNIEETIQRFVKMAENGLLGENVFSLQSDCVIIKTYDNYYHIFQSHPEYLI
jgi:hypothetical protein